jgi:hypothetical protein
MPDKSKTSIPGTVKNILPSFDPREQIKPRYMFAMPSLCTRNFGFRTRSEMRRAKRWSSRKELR